MVKLIILLALNERTMIGGTVVWASVWDVLLWRLSFFFWFIDCFSFVPPCILLSRGPPGNMTAQVRQK